MHLLEFNSAIIVLLKTRDIVYNLARKQMRGIKKMKYLFFDLEYGT